MEPFKILIAATLLSAPEAPLENYSKEELHQQLQVSLMQVAVHWEIMDPRESHHILCNPRNFFADLQLLKLRYEDLMDAPCVVESDRFPKREVATYFINLNRSYRKDLLTRLTLDRVHAEEVRTAILETDRLFNIWDTIRDVRCKYYYVHVRRHALNELREMLGDAAFYCGELPPHLPVWRIPSMD